MNIYQVKSPVLFLIFNRPDTSIRVFNEIRKAKPLRLYVAADGPRNERKNEAQLCEKTRAIIEKIDWDCEVKTLFRQQNLGCRDAVSSAIDWFFGQEKEGIILEDDCLPAESFFRYCDTSLEKYRNDSRVRHIAGCNHQMGKKYGDTSTFLSNQTGVWGWASWSRVWKDYDKTLKAYDSAEVPQQLAKIFKDPFLLEIMIKIFNDVKAGKINTWDFQLAFINYFNNGLSVNPNVNLISNIGYGKDATHSVNEKDPLSNLPTEDIAEIITYPKYMIPETTADYEVLARSFKLSEKWDRHNLLRRRLKRWLKSLIKGTH